MEKKSDEYKAETMQGSYSFGFEGFSGLPNNVGEVLESPEFTLCGHQWQLKIFPGGSREEDNGFVSIYIYNKSKKVVKVNFKLSLVNQKKGGADNISLGDHTFQAEDEWGHHQFIPVNKLTEPGNGFCVNDVVIFKVDLIVYGAPLPMITPLVSSSVSTIRDCVHHMSEEGIGTDVTFSFTNTTPGADADAAAKKPPLLHAHKSVLMARSDVFTAMFTAHMSEANSGLIHMDGSDLTHSVLAEMLHYIYTDTFTSHTALATHSHGLLVAAHKYRVLGLMTTCEDYLSSQLTDDNVVNTLRLADTYNAFNLRQRCMEYIVRHASNRVFLTKEWCDLDEDLRNEVVGMVKGSRSSNEIQAMIHVG